MSDKVKQKIIEYSLVVFNGYIIGTMDWDGHIFMAPVAMIVLGVALARMCAQVIMPTYEVPDVKTQAALTRKAFAARAL